MYKRILATILLFSACSLAFAGGTTCMKVTDQEMQKTLTGTWESYTHFKTTSVTFDIKKELILHEDGTLESTGYDTKYNNQFMFKYTGNWRIDHGKIVVNNLFERGIYDDVYALKAHQSDNNEKVCLIDKNTFTLTNPANKTDLKFTRSINSEHKEIHMKLTDSEIKKMLVGTWEQHWRNGFDEVYDVTYFKADGTFQSKLYNRTANNTLVSKGGGKWRIKNGFLNEYEMYSKPINLDDLSNVILDSFNFYKRSDYDKITFINKNHFIIRINGNETIYDTYRIQ